MFNSNGPSLADIAAVQVIVTMMVSVKVMAGGY